MLDVKDKDGNNIASMSKDGVEINSGMAGKWQITNDYLEFSEDKLSNFTYGNHFFIDENGNPIGALALRQGALCTRIKEGEIEFGAYSSVMTEYPSGKVIKSGYYPMTRFKNGSLETYDSDTDTWLPIMYYSYKPDFPEMSSSLGYFNKIRAIAVEYKTLSQLSSKKYKENIIAMDREDSKKLLELRPCHFDYINGDKNRSGLIAEEVAEILPECVTYNDDKSIHGLDYTRFIPYMIKTIQDQEERIKALEKKLESEGK